MKNETSINHETANGIKSIVKRSATNSDWRKCKWCGKYISFKEMETDAICEFTPDTHFTSEKTEWIHKHCA